MIQGAKARADLIAYEQDRIAKLNAQGISGNTARSSTPTDAEKAAWDEVVNAPTNSFKDLLRRT